MNRQKGQSAVELALILPLFFTMCFAMIYGGMVFMDYLSLNNSARDIARQISLTADKTKQIELKTKFESKNPDYFRQATTLYTATPKVNLYPDAEPVYVKVKIDLNLNANLPGVLTTLKFPPQTLNPIEIVMPLENKFDKKEEESQP